MSEFQHSIKVRDDQDYGSGFNLHFIKDSFLGKGSFGTCVSAVNKSSNQRVAVKIMDKRVLKNQHYEVVEKEGSVLRQLNHPNIIKMLNKIETSTHLYFVMELAEGGDLRKFMTKRNQEGRPLKEAEVAIIMQKIFLAVQYIHSLGIVHRDLKLENILIANPNDLSSIKLCDFGLCGQGDIDNYEISKTFYTRCGTKSYMAPEMFTTYKYNEAVDLFSCGIVMYNLMLGSRPRYFDKDDDSETFLEKLSTIEDNFPSDFSKLAKHLIARLCKAKPNERYNVKEALKHPWITRNPTDEIPLTAPEQVKQVSQAHIFTRLIKAGILLALIQSNNAEKIDKSATDISIKDEYPRLKREKLSLKTLTVEPGKMIKSPSKKSFGNHFQLEIPKRDFLSIPSLPTEVFPSSEYRTKIGSVPPLLPIENEPNISPKKKIITLKKASADTSEEIQVPAPKTPNEGFRINPIKTNLYTNPKREISENKTQSEKKKSTTPLRKIFIQKAESDDKAYAEISTTNESFSPPVTASSKGGSQFNFESPKKSNKLEVPKAFRLLPLDQEDELTRNTKSNFNTHKMIKNPSAKSIGSASMLPSINVYDSSSQLYTEYSTIGGDILVIPPNNKSVTSSKNGSMHHPSNASFNTLVSSSRSSRIGGHKVSGSLIPFDVKSQISESRKNQKFNQMIVSLSNFKVK